MLLRSRLGLVKRRRRRRKEDEEKEEEEEEDEEKQEPKTAPLHKDLDMGPPLSGQETMIQDSKTVLSLGRGQSLTTAKL